jgi:hypothetical protein
MARNMEIKQREADGKFVLWAEIDQLDVDRDWYIKNGLPVPQMWVPMAVTYTKDAAIRAMKQVRI